jgi:hypothetical protein
MVKAASGDQRRHPEAPLKDRAELPDQHIERTFDEVGMTSEKERGSVDLQMMFTTALARRAHWCDGQRSEIRMRESWVVSAGGRSIAAVRGAETAR